MSVPGVKRGPYKPSTKPRGIRKSDYPVDSISGLKECSVCHELKLVDEFYPSSKAKSGIQANCKVCSQASALAFGQSDHGKLIKSVNSAARYLADPEKAKAQLKQWANDNPERLREAAKIWIENNRPRVRAIKSACSAKRRLKERIGCGSKEITHWLVMQPKVCFYCQADVTEAYHVDHYIALSKGGRHEISNLRVACPSCNMRKHTKHPNQFMAELRIAA